MRVFELAASLPWAITPDSLQSILEIAARENLPVEKIEASLGREFDNSENNKGYTVEDGVAVINVHGPIFRRANMFMRISGATSLGMTANSFEAALQDKSVNAILFDIDSPGGEALGIHEFSEKIYKARGQKPIKAYVGGSGCSAAYWIASSADEIVADPTAILGSIGVIATIRDEEEKDAKAGIKNIRIVSSKSPMKRPDLNTEEGRNAVRQNIDALAEVFISTVARNRSSENLQRSFDTDAVVENFGRGGTMIGRDAVGVGMADRLGSFEDVMNSLKGSSSTTRTKSTNGEISMGKNFKERLLALFEEADIAAEAEQPDTTAADGTPVKVVVPEANPEPEKVEEVEEETTKMAEQNAEVAALQAQLEEAKAAIEAANRDKAEALAAADKALTEKLTAEAGKIALGLKHESKLNPAQEAKFVSAYVQMSKDDKANPVAEGESRVATLMSLYEAKTVTSMTEEQLEPEATTTLLSERPDQSDLKKMYEEIDAQAAAYASEINPSIKAANEAQLAVKITKPRV